MNTSSSQMTHDTSMPGSVGWGASVLTLYASVLSSVAKIANVLQPILALGLRWYVSWQFLTSGWLKLSNWPQTLDLFQSEYHVPLLPPYPAAVVGTFGELFFPVLLVLGIGGRIGPLGLFAVNVMAVVSYAHVLLQEGFEAALGQHVLWGVMLGVLAIYGQGAIALDRLLQSRLDRHGINNGINKVRW